MTTLKKPGEGSNPLDETLFNSQFTRIVLAVKLSERDELECLEALHDCDPSDTNKNSSWNDRLNETRESLAGIKQTMVNYIADLDESDIDKALRLAAIILRKEYSSEEAAQPKVTTGNPVSLRPIGITKSLDLRDAVSQELARRKQPTPEATAAEPTAVDKTLTATQADLATATAETPENLKEFEKDLIELAVALNKAIENRNQTMIGVIMDEMAHLGAEQMLRMTGENGTLEKIRAVFEKLKLAQTTPEQMEGFAFNMGLRVIGYGVNDAAFSIISSPQNPEEVRTPFDAVAFRDEFLVMIAATRAFRQAVATGAFEGQESSSEQAYNAMVRKVAAMSPKLKQVQSGEISAGQMKTAMAIANECFASTETDLAEGPRTLRKAGAISSIIFRKDVEQEMINMGREEAEERD